MMGFNYLRSHFSNNFEITDFTGVGPYDVSSSDSLLGFGITFPLAFTQSTSKYFDLKEESIRFANSTMAFLV